MGRRENVDPRKMGFNHTVVGNDEAINALSNWKDSRRTKTMKSEKELEMEFLGSDPKKKARKKMKVVTDKKNTPKDVVKVRNAINTVDWKGTFKTIEHFIESVALLTVSIFTGLVAYKHYTNEWFGYFYVGCAILILLMGAGLFVSSVILKRK